MIEVRGREGVLAIKTHPESFEATSKGRKPYDVRVFDRDYRVGDLVVLVKFDPIANAYLGAMLVRVITYVTKPGTFGLPVNVGVFGHEPISDAIAHGGCHDEVTAR